MTLIDVEPLQAVRHVRPLAGRWDRQLSVPGFGPRQQQRIRTARIVVVGAGGVGSGVLPALAAAGIGELVVVDHDDVEPSNLHRQTLHTTADVGRGKTDSAVEALRPLAAGTVTGVRRRLTDQNAAALIAGADLVIDASDSLAARYALDDAAASARIPLVWGSAQGTTGYVGVAWTTAGPRWRDLFPVQPADHATPSCSETGVFPGLCATVGGLLATEAIKLLTSLGEPLIGRVLVVDALTGRICEIPYSSDTAASSSMIAPADATVSPDSADETGTAGEAEEQDSPAAPVRPTEIDAPALQRLLQSPDGDVQLVDVREQWEAQIATLPGSVLIPLGELPGRLGELDRERAVVTYCHSGVRSAEAARLLTAQGFQATSLRGGINAWSNMVDPRVPRY
ncbi:ThiF family adenylyltransferase [uncultured Amnibacterium sp.]|uniref:ThiF family adenylyltransferase n=1 Tax=uncultured Amnibacterium sp. TaxID=1631851 RepID=UPI0035C9EFD5